MCRDVCFLLLLMAVGALSAPTPAARGVPAAEVQVDFDHQVPRDLRIAVDLARFELGNVRGGVPWVVAEIKPYAGLRQEYVDLGTDAEGELVGPKEPKLLLLEEGSFEALENLSIPMGRPIREYRRHVGGNEQDPEDGMPYSPFRNGKGGLVICRIDERMPGLSRFRPAILIPPSWREHVLPAVRRYRETRAVWEPKAAAVNRDRLEVLLTDKNPFIALTASRTLARAGLLATDAIFHPTATSDRWRQAALIIILLRATSPEAVGRVADDIAATAERRQADEVCGVALAGYAMGCRPRDLEEIGNRLMVRLHRRFTNLSRDKEPEAYLSAVLKVVEFERP